MKKLIDSVNEIKQKYWKEFKVKKVVFLKNQRIAYHGCLKYTSSSDFAVPNIFLIRESNDFEGLKGSHSLYLPLPFSSIENQN